MLLLTRPKKMVMIAEKTEIINTSTNCKTFRLGKWEKDVLCGLLCANPLETPYYEDDDLDKFEKYASQMNESDRRCFEAGRVVHTSILVYFWGSSSFNPAEPEELDTCPPGRSIKCRTLKTLQSKGLIIAESLGLSSCRKFYSLTGEGKNIAQKLTS
jgi:hypothetical protein